MLCVGVATYGRIDVLSLGWGGGGALVNLPYALQE